MLWLLGRGRMPYRMVATPRPAHSTSFTPRVASTHVSHRARLYAFFAGCVPSLSSLCRVGRYLLAGPSQISLALTQAKVRRRLLEVEGDKRRLAYDV